MEPRNTRAIAAVKAEFAHPGGIEELEQAADAVESMMASEGWRVLAAFVETARARVDQTLDAAVEPLSRARYAQLHGLRGGLSAFHDYANAVISHRAAVIEEQRRKHEQPVNAGDGRQ